MSVRSFTDTQLPTSALRSGLLGIGVQKSLRAEVLPDSLVVDTGTAADDGLTTPRQQPVAKKPGLLELTVNAEDSSPRALTAGREATNNPCRSPRSFWGAGGLL